MAGYFSSLFGGGQGSPSAFTSPGLDPRSLAMLIAMQNQGGGAGAGGAMAAGPRSFGTPGAAPGAPMMPQPPGAMGAGGAPMLRPNPNVMGQPGAQPPPQGGAPGAAAGAGGLSPQVLQQLLQLLSRGGIGGGAPMGGGPMSAPSGPPL